MTNQTRKNRAPRKQPPKKTPGQAAVWGAYIPDIFRSYPDMPVRGMIKDGKCGKEFWPDGSQQAPKHRRSPELKNWITGPSYDNVLQKMRETADEAIKELKSGIARLERFIDEN